MKSAFERGREAALADLERFLIEASTKARIATIETNDGKLASERLSAFDRGVYTGIFVAYDKLLEHISNGTIPRAEGSLLPKELNV